MEATGRSELVSRFNNCINRRDLEGLVGLMTDDHTFVDSAGGKCEGRESCQAAWRGFFKAFPDYRNEFKLLVERDDIVAALGRSHCSDPRLAGPAIWVGMISGELLSEWRVYDDTPQTRRRLGIEG